MSTADVDMDVDSVPEAAPLSASPLNEVHAMEIDSTDESTAIPRIDINNHAAVAGIDEDDELVAEYDIYITPQSDQQVFIMQYPNRAPDQPLTKENGSAPDHVRYKPESGFIELDIPLDTKKNIDRVESVRWGESVRKTKSFGQKSYGIAGGFERNMPRTANRAGASSGDALPASQFVVEDDNFDDYVNNFEDANEKGHALNTMIMGGQIQKDDGKGPQHMVGVFRGSELHLTKVDGIVQMRQNFHHIDAIDQMNAVGRRREKEAQEGAKPAEPKAFLPTVKKTGGDTPAEITQAFLRTANQEKWESLTYTDENDELAFETYQDRLFLNDTASAPTLRSRAANAEFLDHISGSKPAKKKPVGKRKGSETILASDDSGSEWETSSEDSLEDPPVETSKQEANEAIVDDDADIIYDTVGVDKK